MSQQSLPFQQSQTLQQSHTFHQSQTLEQSQTFQQWPMLHESLKLNLWQQIEKPLKSLIVQASTIDGMDGQTAPSIGMAYGFVECCNQNNTQIGNHTNLVLFAINVGTDHRRRGQAKINRASICKTLENNGFHNQSLTSADYFNTLPSYKFVISPEGNGVDCHRHYEALMAGCIPIVEENPIIREKYGNVPILWTKDYSEITETYLLENYKIMLKRQWDFSKLFLSYWSPEEQQLIKYRGNFWCKRLTGKSWYV